MDWPYKFPHPGDEVAREAARFRRLTPDEQMGEVIGLAAIARRQIESSPNRAAIEAQLEASEREWQRAHREAFARHGY